MENKETHGANGVKMYEGMFVVDSAKAAADWDGTIGFIKNILSRSDAEIVSINKWDERKLAYDIKKASRGTYVLCYFKADGGKISEIERDVRLSEQIMRVLILSTEAMSPEDIEKETPAMLAEKYGRKAAEKEAVQEEAPSLGVDTELEVSETELPEETESSDSSSELGADFESEEEEDGEVSSETGM